MGRSYERQMTPSIVNLKFLPTEVLIFGQTPNQRAFKNVKVKASNEYHNESTQPKVSILQICPKIFR